DGDEQPADLEIALGTGDRVAQLHTTDRGVAVDVDDLAVPDPLDLGIGLRAVDHDPTGAQRVPAVNDGHRVREPGEEGGFLHRGVAAADHGDVLVAEEEPVAGGAPGDAVPGQLVLAGQPELAVGGAHGQDHGVRGV